MDQLKDFLEIEKKYNLYEEEIEGINYWNYSRFIVWRDEIRKNEYDLSSGEGKKKKKIGEKIRIALGLLKNSLLHANTTKKNVQVLILNHERRVLDGKDYICKYTETLTDNLEDYVVLEHPYQEKHFQPVRTQNLVYSDRYVIMGNLYAKIATKMKTKYYHDIWKQVKATLEKPIAEMENSYHVKLDMDKVVTDIVKRFLMCKVRKKSYRRFLEKVNPKVIVEVVGYSMDHMIFNELAKERNILTIELQHGAISDWHCAYRYNTQHIVPQIPDKMLIFGDYWKNFLQLPIKDADIVSIGFPFFEKNIDKYIKRDNHKKYEILFLSQRTIGKQLSQFAVECYKQLDLSKYHIIYKLHPSEYYEWREKYPELKECQQMEVVDSGEKDLYDYFAEADLQVGVYSTSVYEGLGFRIPTCIYYLEGSCALQKLCDLGMAGLVKTPEDLQNYIENNQKNEIDYSFFWKENAAQNLLNYVKEMC